MLVFHEGAASLTIIRDALKDRFQELAQVSVATVWRVLHQEMSYSFRKAVPRSRRVLGQDRQAHIVKHFANIEHLEASFDSYWSVDESSVWAEMGSNYRWGEKGQRLIFHETGNVKKYSLILGISSEGEFFGRLVDGGFTAIVYANYLAELKKYAGDGALAIWQDNLPAHRSKIVLATASKLGIAMNFTAPYFLEGNSVEYAFAYIKCGLKMTLQWSKDELLEAINNRLHTASKNMMSSLFMKAKKEAAQACLNFK